MTFAFSKLLWAIIAPGTLLSFLLASGLVLTTAPKAAVVKVGRRFCLVAVTCFVAIAILPVGDWALTPLENRFVWNPVEQVDGIIVLGGDEQTEITEARGTPTALDSMRRYLTVVDMTRRYPDAKLVFSGGSPFVYAHRKVLDSEIARDIMFDIGVPTDRMVLEKNSRNTYENAIFAFDIVRPEPAQKWLLVTSASHMPRAMACFRKAGWNVSAAPSGYFTTGRYLLRPVFNFDVQMHELTLALHEYVGLVSYRLMGRTTALWPS